MKIAYLVTARTDIEPEQFRSHWTTMHAGLAKQMPELCGYEINLPLFPRVAPDVYDGFAVLDFPTYESAKAAWSSSAGQATAKDGELFMKGTSAVIFDVDTRLEPPTREGLCTAVYLGSEDAPWSDHAISSLLTLPHLLGLELRPGSVVQKGPRPVGTMLVLWFESYERLTESWTSPQGRAVSRGTTGGPFPTPQILAETIVVV